MKKLILFLMLLLWGQKVFALSVIRDSEIENVLTNYVRQIFEAVKLPPENADGKYCPQGSSEPQDCPNGKTPDRNHKKCV